MASPLTHAVMAGTIAVGIRIPRSTIRYWILGVICAEIPDIDVIGFWIGIPYEHMLGHRGITHSILFAVVFSWGLARWASGWKDMPYVRLWWYLFLAAVSHTMLDALTDGGLGVALFAPFDNARYFFPIHPVKVTPLEPDHAWGAVATVLVSEASWIWLPCALFLAARWLVDRQRAQEPV